MNKRKCNQMLSNITYNALLLASFLPQMVYANGSNGVNSDVTKILVDITDVLLIVAGLVCVGKVIQIGIMFMTSSIEQKSNAKMAILPWLVGTIVCFGASWIGKAIIGIFNNHKTDVLSY